jgi:parvulin-like peptidyl-prolyl isomerase
MEYGINNWAYSANNGDVSPLIKGDGGWYVAKLISRHIPSDQDFQFAKASVRQRLFQEREQRFMMDWIQNQKDNASIVDYRVHR